MPPATSAQSGWAMASVMAKQQKISVSSAMIMASR
jgi:hypothetical protein